MTDLVPSYPSLSGQRLAGRYLVEDLVGRGAVSEVYRARDLWEARPVAVKVLRTGAADVPRFEKEVALLRRLRHPHLVSLCDAGEHRGLPYLVLDLLERTLADAMASGPLPADDVARVGREVASALAYVHADGIVHRDVKPSNLLLAADGSARLADLGAARLVDGSRLTATGMTIGTPAYLAPEQVDGSDVGPAADVYALGLVLIEAASGRRAFDGTQQELLAARLSRRPDVPAAIPGSWRAVVAAMTELDPRRRPSAATVVERLDGRHVAAAVPTTAVLPAAGTGGAGSGEAGTAPHAAADVDPSAERAPGAHGGVPRRGAEEAAAVGATAILPTALASGTARRAPGAGGPGPEGTGPGAGRGGTAAGDAVPPPGAGPEGPAAAAAHGDRTAVLPARPLPRSPDGPPTLGAALRRRLGERRERVALWAVVGAVALGLLLGIASASGGSPFDARRPVLATTPDAPSTTTTLGPTTTTAPPVAAVPIDPPQGCGEDCEDDEEPPEGRGGGKGKGKGDKDDD